MRLLLDTHAFLWWWNGDKRLTPQAHQAIADADLAYVSVASAWEVAIKVAAGKLTIPRSFEAGVAESDCIKLPIAFSHAAATAELQRHHGDPFDRMLIAQALVEGLTIVTHDRHFKLYQVPVIWT